MLQQVPEQPAAVLVRRVQRGGDQPVAGVEVGLPVAGVVLVAPGQVPDRRAGQRDRREAGGQRPQAVLGVVPLDEQRQRQADRLERPRAGSGTSTSRCSRRRSGGAVRATRAGTPRRSRGRSAVSGALRQKKLRPVDDLAHGVQDRAVLQGQHLAADERRARRVGAKAQGPQDAVGLELDVVVQEQRRASRRCCVNASYIAAGEAAAAAEVGLVDDPQPVAQGRLRPRRSARRPRPACCPGRRRRRRASASRTAGVLGEGAAARPRSRPAGCRCRCRPRASAPRRAGRPARTSPASLDRRGLVGGDVEPVPAAVDERVEVELELERVAGPVVHRRRSTCMLLAVGLRAVDVDPAAAADASGAGRRTRSDGPAPPVAGREGVEVGGEGDLASRRRSSRGVPVAHLRPAGVRPRRGRGVRTLSGRPGAA